MDRGAWRATAHKVTKRWTQMKGLSTSTHRSPWVKLAQVPVVGARPSILS